VRTPRHPLTKQNPTRERSIKSTRSNIRDYGTTKARSNGGGRSRSVPPLMIDALCEHLLWDDFEVLVSTSSISRASWYLVHTEYTGAVTYEGRVHKL
jgi:hypothetical protein